MKHCKRCNQTKSLEQFGRNASKPDKKQDWCKFCINTHVKQKNYFIKMQRNQLTVSVDWHYIKNDILESLKKFNESSEYRQKAYADAGLLTN